MIPSRIFLNPFLESKEVVGVNTPLTFFPSISKDNLVLELKLPPTCLISSSVTLIGSDLNLSKDSFIFLEESILEKSTYNLAKNSSLSFLVILCLIASLGSLSLKGVFKYLSADFIAVLNKPLILSNASLFAILLSPLYRDISSTSFFKSLENITQFSLGISFNS